MEESPSTPDPGLQIPKEATPTPGQCWDIRLVDHLEIRFVADGERRLQISRYTCAGKGHLQLPALRRHRVLSKPTKYTHDKLTPTPHRKDTSPRRQTRSKTSPAHNHQIPSNAKRRIKPSNPQSTSHTTPNPPLLPHPPNSTPRTS